MTRAYPLDNYGTDSQLHHLMLSDMLDDITLNRLRLLIKLPGKNVLEIGSGHGYLTHLLADLVGEEGSVTALDIAPKIDRPGQNIHVVTHDVTHDEPLPVGPVDLAHARLVLQHLPARVSVLDRMIRAVRPGGLVLVEDWRAVRDNVVVASPDTDTTMLYTQYIRTLGRIFDHSGNDPDWPERIHATMMDRGLVNVTTTIHGAYWPGGSSGQTMRKALLPQFRDRLRNFGMSDDQLDRLPAVLDDPRLVARSHLLYSTAGYVPAA